MFANGAFQRREFGSCSNGTFNARSHQKVSSGISSGRLPNNAFFGLSRYGLESLFSRMLISKNESLVLVRVNRLRSVLPKSADWAERARPTPGNGRVGRSAATRAAVLVTKNKKSYPRLSAGVVNNCHKKWV